MNYPKYFIFFFFLLFSDYDFAQNHPGKKPAEPSIFGKITGTVINSKTNQPVEFATIALIDSKNKKIVNGTISENKGFFKLENVAPGTYSIIISFLGYDQKSIDSVITTLEKPDINVGKTMLSPSYVSLKDVVIETDAAVIENKVDKIVYNTEKDVTAQTGDASDILSKVPMVSVDIDGNVQLRGSSNVRILINGKPSGMMANSIADALKSIPADQIKSVEVITSPSAKYDAEGTAGIINIITHKNNIEGITGNINATTGTRRNSLNAALSIKKGRFGFNSGINGHYGIPRPGTSEFYREDYINGQTRILLQTGDFIALRQGYSANIGLEYDINAYNNISAGAKIGYFGFDRSNDVNITLIDPANAINQQYKRSSTNPTNRESGDFNLDYRRTFENSKKELFASVLYNSGFNRNNYTLIQNGNADYLNLDERSFSGGWNNEFSGQMDYVHPIKEKATLEAGLKSINRKITSDYKYEFLDDSLNLYHINYSRSDSFSYYQNVYAAYAQVGFKFKEKYEMKLGGRYEYTGIYGLFNAGNDSVENSYFNIIPSFAISRKLKEYSSLRINYSQRLQRPGLNFINPFVDAGDPKNISYGNPGLTPELTHNIELTFAGFSPKVSFTISGYTQYTTNSIQSYVEIDTTGVLSSTFYNIGTSLSNGINLFGQLTISEKFTARGSINSFYMIRKGEFKDEALSNSGFQYNMHLNLSYDFGKGYYAESFLMLNSPRITLQGTVPSFSRTSFGFKKEFREKKGSIGLSISNPITGQFRFSTELKSTSFYQSSTNTIPFRAIGVSYSYRFGKLETKNTRKNRRENKTDDLKKDDGGEF